MYMANCYRAGFQLNLNIICSVPRDMKHVMRRGGSHRPLAWRRVATRKLLYGYQSVMPSYDLLLKKYLQEHYSGVFYIVLNKIILSLTLYSLNMSYNVSNLFCTSSSFLFICYRTEESILNQVFHYISIFVLVQRLSNFEQFYL